VIPPAGRHGGDGAAIARSLGVEVGQVVDLSMTLNPFAPDITELARHHLDGLRIWPALAEQSAQPVRPARRSGEHADVWDEAFYPLATGTWTRGDGEVVLGSLTKLFACPGLRLGYLLADDVARFAVAQPEWSVNGLAVAILPELVARADLVAWSEAISGRRDQLAELLRGHGLPPRPSHAPWLLVDAPGLRERLARVASSCATARTSGDPFRRARLSRVARQRGRRFTPAGTSFARAREDRLDRLGDLVEQHLDLNAIGSVIASAAPPRQERT
jgi:hypothetical protein